MLEVANKFVEILGIILKSIKEDNLCVTKRRKIFKELLSVAASESLEAATRGAVMKVGVCTNFANFTGKHLN